jgi:pyruvate kinase
MRKTKIVCTIGPASRDPQILEQLIHAGMNVARLNFSHGSHEEHGEHIANIRQISEKLNKPVAILQDIAGPKIRIGEFRDGAVTLESGQSFTLTDHAVPGDAQRVSVNYQGLPRLVQMGDLLLLSDGTLELEVIEADDHSITCRVLVGGTLSSHKGVNLPSRSTGIPILTDKDKQDLRFGLDQGVDYIALSFVRSAMDINEVRNILRDRNADTPIIAKIEKPEALKNIDAILEAVDGLMVARGDLGVEIPFEQVPLAQKKLIHKANVAGKPVITATQMLESMVNSPRPTRAEVTDVANAVLDGTDAIMLSEESAMGAYPVRAVQAMHRIAEDAEKHFPYREWTDRIERSEDNGINESVAHAACEMAENLDIHVIITCTQSGTTARQVAKHRPPYPILAPTPQQSTYLRLALIWGVVPLHLPVLEHTDQMIRAAFEAAVDAGFLTAEQPAVITAGVPVNKTGNTNLLLVINAEMSRHMQGGA